MTAYLRPIAELIAVSLFMGGLMLASLTINESRRVPVRPAEMVVRSAHLEAGR